MSDKKLYKKLPAVQQTTAIKNFFESTVEQLFSKANAESVQGFIGSRDSSDTNLSGQYLSEPTNTKRFYALSPTVNTINQDTGESENLIFYDELIDTLATYGIDVKDHNKLFSEQFATFLPPIDPDKLLNYSEYYWFPRGPSTIKVEGTAEYPIDIDLDVIGKTQFTPFNGKTFRNGMVVQFSGDYVIPQSKTLDEYIVAGVGDSIRLLPKKDNFSTRFTTVVEDEFDQHPYTTTAQETRYSAGPITGIQVSSAGQGYVSPNILIYSDVRIKEDDDSAGLALDYPDAKIEYIDSAGQQTYEVSLEQALKLYVTDNTPADFTAAQTIISKFRTDNASANVSLTSNGGISATVDTDSQGDNYSGEITLSVFDTLVEHDIDVSLMPTDPSFVTNKFYLTDTQNVKVGQRTTGLFQAIVTQIIPADAPAGIDAHIIIDRDITVIASDMNADPTLRFYGMGFQALAEQNTVRSINTGITLLTTQAKVGVNPYNTDDYYFIGGNWDSDLNNDGIGDVAWAGAISQTDPDYILQERGAPNRNVWSRVNFWYHRDNFVDAGDSLPSREYRANRPIIEFNKNLELYNHAKSTAGSVTLAVTGDLTLEDLKLTDSFDTVDGVPLEGATFIFPFELPENNKYIYTAKVITEGPDLGKLQISRVGDPATNPEGVVDGDIGFVPFEMSPDQSVQILSGNYGIGIEYIYNGTEWYKAQEKLTPNQPPLFTLYDNNGVPLDDNIVYPASTFKGNKLFGYATTQANGTTVSTQDDTVLGFPLVYKQYKASSEIVFENYQYTQQYTYQAVTDPAPIEFKGYAYYRDIVENNYHSYWRMIDAPVKQRVITTYTLTQLDIDNIRVGYDIGCIPNRDPDLPSGYDIQVKINNEIKTNFTYGTRKPGQIEFTSGNLVVGDFIEISAGSDTGLLSTTSGSKYELPLGWGHNPRNEEISFTSEPEYLEHFVDYIKTQKGFTGDPLGSNNFNGSPKHAEGAKSIVQTNQDIILGSYLLDDQPHNLVDAMRFCQQEFTKYKNRFRNELNNFYNNFYQEGQSTESALEQVLKSLISFNVGKEVFNRTYIVPFGDNFTLEDFTLALAQTQVTLNTDIDLNQIQNSLLVYHNDKLYLLSIFIIKKNYPN